MILLKKFKTLLRIARNPAKLPHLLLRIDRYALFGASPESISPPVPLDGTECVKLTDDDFNRLPDGFEIQVERFRRYGFNAAYGVLHHGRLVHINWLFLADQQKARHDRIFKLKHDEAEIAHCFTLPDCRGRGFQPFAIRFMCQEAGQIGIRKALSIVNLTNIASLRGLEKANFERCGTIIRILLPLLKTRLVVRFPRIRWGGRHRSR